MSAADQKLDALLDCMIMSDWEVGFVDSLDKLRMRRQQPLPDCATALQLNKLYEIYDDRIVEAIPAKED